MSGASLALLGLDLRLADNPALHQAVAAGGAVIPVFVWAPEEEAPWAPGAASRWWLHQSLAALERDLAGLGSRLMIRRGPTAETLLTLAAESGARHVFWNRRYEPAVMARDRDLEQRLAAGGIGAYPCRGNLLFEPGSILNASGKPFQVFTPFWRACLAANARDTPLAVPSRLPAPELWPESLVLEDLHLLPRPDWAGGLRTTWQPGETGAARRFAAFLAGPLENYPAARDRPDLAGTSRLSPHLHFGEISARQIWHRLQHSGGAADAYLRQLIWREFSYHLLVHFPYTTRHALRPEFQFFPWETDARAFQAWTRGQTGYPIVDAGMRELWHTGWMHNRVRMIAASFLVKHLLIPWQEGAAWFWDTLVDADLANNTMGWQWTAGCGADAAPYFRIFNPMLQARKFDPEGEYVRRWVPEQAELRPIVDHAAARARALAAFAALPRGPDR